MAKTGPPPKPTALKRLDGNVGHRPLPQHEPEPPPGAPDPPRHLTAEARSEWDRIVPLLLQLNLLSHLDRSALSAYCQSWARHVEAEEQLAKASSLAFTKTGYPIINPWTTISKQAVEQMAKFLAEFGLTPAARSRLITEGGGASPQEAALLIRQTIAALYATEPESADPETAVPAAPA